MVWKTLLCSDTNPFDFRIGVNNIEKVVSPVVEKGLKSVLLFGVVTKLDKVNCCLKELCHEIQTN